MTSNTIFPASAFIGFEHMLDELTNFTAKTNNNYPPHNVIKVSETQSLIEIAVAGFSLDELTIELKDTQLVVVGDHVVKGRELNFLVKSLLTAGIVNVKFFKKSNVRT